MPQGKAAVPLSEKSIPLDSGLSSGRVPFVCKLFPRHPGYVITVCALAIDAVATRANIQLMKNMSWSCARKVREQIPNVAGPLPRALEASGQGV